MEDDHAECDPVHSQVANESVTVLSHPQQHTRLVEVCDLHRRDMAQLTGNADGVKGHKDCFLSLQSVFDKTAWLKIFATSDMSCMVHVCFGLLGYIEIPIFVGKIESNNFNISVCL